MAGMRLTGLETKPLSRVFTPLHARLAKRSGRTDRLAPKAVVQEIDIHAAMTSIEQILQHPHMIDDQMLQRILHIADAAATATPAVGTDGKPIDNGWIQPLVGALEYVLKEIQFGLDKYKVPYSYGWSIVALTAFTKLLTFPLVKKQVESSMAMQNLKPEIDKIKAKYGEEKEAVSRETSALYEKAGVNPLAGCLPSIATIPIFIGLYRSLTSVAQEGALDNQGFYWIPSLAGPTTMAAQKAGTGTAWLLPLVDGAPPIGWELASHYLVLPVALVIAQYISSAIISPPVDPNNENAGTTKALLAFLPLMVGWFSLNVPAGLGLYYFSNTVLTSAQQIFLRKLGGANVGEFDLGPIDLGKARRTGTVAGSGEDSMAMSLASAGSESDDGSSVANGVSSMNGNGASAYSADMSFADNSTMSVVSEDEGAGGIVEAAAAAVPTINRRCKRKKRDLLEASS